MIGSSLVLAATVLTGALPLPAAGGSTPRPAGATAAARTAETAGASIYLRGVIGSGATLEGTREGGVRSTGVEAACVSCHQRSGLGSIEGRVWVPPVTGDYLFNPRSDEPGGSALPYVGTRRGDREPYTEETLARAIREGIDSRGQALGYLMPRYALGDADMRSLIAYLERLTVRDIPGVTDAVLHFATVVTPDADPVKRSGMLDVLRNFVIAKNAAPLKPSPPMRSSARTQYSKSMYMANRRWQLHVWELTGAPSAWQAQLEKRLAAQPVYALLSGLGGSDWAPVHAFCERHEIPCLFPNVEVPVVAEGDFYPLYFSRGVLLEADLIAGAILGPEGRPAVGAVEQVYRAGDSGEAGAAELAKRLGGRGLSVHRTVLPARARGGAIAAALREAERRASASDRALVLWLRPAELADLGDPPSGSAPLYLSGLMAGLEDAPLSAAWRERAVMSFPFDLPSKRGVRLDYPLGWFSFTHIKVVAEQSQTDTYLACSLLADVLNRMADNFSRPYLIEQLQESLEHRLITGYYPRLSLATGQRFASKGGYLVRFKGPTGRALVAQGDWTVP